VREEADRSPGSLLAFHRRQFNIARDPQRCGQARKDVDIELLKSRQSFARVGARDHAIHAEAKTKKGLAMPDGTEARFFSLYICPERAGLAIAASPACGRRLLGL
jgi:hypothetical protein